MAGSRQTHLPCPAIEHPDWVDVIALRHEGEVIHAFGLPLADFIEKVEARTIELPALQLAGCGGSRARLKARGVPGTSIPFP